MSKIARAEAELGSNHPKSQGRRLLLYGAGGHAASVADIALEAGFDIVGVVDDGASPGGVLGFPLLGNGQSIENHTGNFDMAALCVGDNAARERIAAALMEMGIPLATLIHPHSAISRHAALADGVVVMAGAVVNARTRVESGAVINTGCTVDHDCVVGAYSYISPGVNLGGMVHVGRRTLIGIGAAVRQGIRIGSDVIVGVGSVVVKDIPDAVTAFGVPASIRMKEGNKQ